MKQADGRNVSVEVMNERRRFAVRLRLNGMKVAEVAEQADLSVPTVIAAHKAALPPPTTRTSYWRARSTMNLGFRAQVRAVAAMRPARRPDTNAQAR